MKKKLLGLLVCLAAAIPMQAQTAKEVLDQTASHFNKSGGIQATFNITIFSDGRETGAGQGTICIKGDKFRIDSPQIKIWFDGTTQWSLLAGSDEVNVSHPTEAELQSMNPYTFVNMYKTGYRYAMTDTTLRGQACHEVTLTAENDGNGIRSMILDIDKSRLWPLCIRLNTAPGKWTRISAYDISDGHGWDDGYFRFDHDDYPGTEIIDLR